MCGQDGKQRMRAEAVLRKQKAYVKAGDMIAGGLRRLYPLSLPGFLLLTEISPCMSDFFGLSFIFLSEYMCPSEKHINMFQKMSLSFQMYD